MEEPSEGLVRAAAAGDDDAFASLVHHYEDHVRRFLVHFLGDATLAEDVAQDTFVRVYRGLPSFAFRSGLSSWVFQIARNCAVDALRSRQRRDRVVTAVTPARIEEGTSRDPVPSASAELAAAIASLSDKLREALLLVEVYGLTYREAGEVLGTAEGTVKSRVHQARRQLDRWMATEEAARDV
ncbi:MAG: RNA polymerase sigma factor [Acidimicrobiales bacterium]|nr:RNA polymerase sigma factor [Acidimicrobiales bacterium]